MTDYITRCTLDLDGQAIEDFKKFTENERELAKQIKLMNKTGTAGVNPVIGFKVDYVMPEDSDEFDFESVKDGVMTVEYTSGKRKTFSGVRTLKVGEETIDGENEVVKTIEFGASGRNVE